MPAPMFNPATPFPPLGLHHPYEAVHQWLCHAYGCHPDQMVATDPAQNFSPVIDLEPLMRLLGGPWLTAVKRCHDAKDSTNDKRKDVKMGNTGDGADGCFQADTVKRNRRLYGENAWMQNKDPVVCNHCRARPGFLHEPDCFYLIAVKEAMTKAVVPPPNPPFRTSAGISMDNSAKADKKDA